MRACDGRGVNIVRERVFLLYWLGLGILSEIQRRTLCKADRWAAGLFASSQMWCVKRHGILWLGTGPSRMCGIVSTDATARRDRIEGQDTWDEKGT